MRRENFLDEQIERFGRLFAEPLAISLRVEKAVDVIDVLSDLFVLRGVPRFTSGPIMGRSSRPRLSRSG